MDEQTTDRPAPQTTGRRQSPNLDEKRSRDASVGRLWWLLFLLATAALALPFAVVQEPPLLDYPNHLARAFVLAHLAPQHDAVSQTFAQAYRADWRPYPYILMDLAIVGLQRVLPVEVAGKLMLSAAMVALPLATAWFLWQANRRSIHLALLACALSYNVLYFWGFNAYQLSVAGGMAMLGTWLWYQRAPTWGRGTMFAVLTFATYFAHLMGFAAAAFLLVFYQLTRKGWRERWRLAAFLAPPTLLFLWARPALSGAKQGVVFRSWSEKFADLRDLPTHGYLGWTDDVVVWGLLACLLLAVLGNRQLRVQWRWAAAVVGLLAVYLLLPYGLGSGFDLDVRLVAPLVLASLAVFDLGPRAKWVAALAVLLVGVRVYDACAGFRLATATSATLNGGIATIARGARVYPSVDTCDDDDPLNHYYVHYWAYAVIRRGAVSPYLFDIPGQTPMRIRWQPYMPSGFWQHCEQPQPDWRRVAADYDYIWSYGEQRFTAPIQAVADAVYARDALVVYRVRR